MKQVSTFPGDPATAESASSLPLRGALQNRCLGSRELGWGIDVEERIASPLAVGEVDRNEAGAVEPLDDLARLVAPEELFEAAGAGEREITEDRMEAATRPCHGD